jgi:3-isopropylmalate dehydrogenase
VYNTDAVLFELSVTQSMTMIQKQSATGARIVEIEKRIRSFANIRPIKPYSTLLDSSFRKKEIIEGADFIIFRELTGGVYFGEKIKRIWNYSF